MPNDTGVPWGVASSGMGDGVFFVIMPGLPVVVAPGNTRSHFSARVKGNKGGSR